MINLLPSEQVTFTPAQLGLDYDGGYLVSEVFEGDNLGEFDPDDEITISVNPSGERRRKLKHN